MREKVLIVLANGDYKDGARMGTVMLQAITAAALEYEVEVILTGVCSNLAVPGVAEGVKVPGEAECTLYELMHEAYEAGVLFNVNPVPMVPMGEWSGEVISEVEDVVNDGYLINQSLDEGTVVYTY